MDDIRIVICTFPDAATARQIGTVLVGKQLAACMNLMPAIESVYRWQGQVESETEALALFKTTAAGYPAFERALAGLHPYEVPEIIALQPDDVAGTYLQWVCENVHA